MELSGIPLFKLKELIKRHTDRSRYDSGKAFFQNGKVINDYAKFEGGTALLYGTVVDEYRGQNYSGMVT